MLFLVLSILLLYLSSEVHGITTSPHVVLEVLDFNNTDGYLGLGIKKSTAMLLGSGKVAKFKRKKISGAISAGGEAMTGLTVHLKVKCVKKMTFSSLHLNVGEVWLDGEVVVQDPTKWSDELLIPSEDEAGRPFEFEFKFWKVEGCKRMKIKDLTATAYSGTI